MQYTFTDFITRQQASTARQAVRVRCEVGDNPSSGLREDSKAHAGMLGVQQLCVKAQQQEITEQQQY
jgi:hypothetical protein